MAVTLDELIKTPRLAQKTGPRGEMAHAGRKENGVQRESAGPQGPRGERPAEFDEIQKLFEAISAELRQLHLQLEGADHRETTIETEVKKPHDKRL